MARIVSIADGDDARSDTETISKCRAYTVRFLPEHRGVLTL